MPLGRSVLVVTVVTVSCSSCAFRQTTTSLPPVPDRPQLAEEVTLHAAGETGRGKITELRGDTIVFLPIPYWGAEARLYPLDAVTSIEVRRPGRGGSGYLYGFAVGFAVIGAMAASEAQYDEDYSSGLTAAGLLGLLVTGPVGAVVGSSSRTTIYDVPAMSVERRRELVRRLMGPASDEPRVGEGAW